VASHASIFSAPPEPDNAKLAPPPHLPPTSIANLVVRTMLIMYVRFVSAITIVLGEHPRMRQWRKGLFLPLSRTLRARSISSACPTAAL
jgi:hypothetical protein